MAGKSSKGKAAPAVPARGRGPARTVPERKAAEAGRWVLVYRPAGRGASPVVWLVVEGVPAGTTAAAVSTALEGWRSWPRYAASVAPGAALSLRKATAAALPGAEARTPDSVTWAQLTPETRRMTVEVPPGVHAAATRAARAAGQTLGDWAVSVIATAAVVDRFAGPVEL